MLTIISNTHRNSQQKVFLNPDTSQTFEQMLADVGSMIRLQRPPVTALYMAHPPYRKVSSLATQSINQLILLLCAHTPIKLIRIPVTDRSDLKKHMTVLGKQLVNKLDRFAQH